MNKSKKILTLLLCICMLLQLCACGKSSQTNESDITIIEDDSISDKLPQVSIGQPQVSTELEPGYITTELAMPEGYKNFNSLQSLGDKLYLHATTQEGNFAVFQYDTITGEWQSWNIETGNAKYAQIDGFSVVEGAVWIRLFEGYSDNEVANRNFSRKLNYYLITLNPETGKQTCALIDFWRNGNSNDPYLTGFVALDAERALLNDDETVRLISKDAQILEIVDLPLMGFTSRVWIGDTMYLSTTEGYCAFDKDTLQFGEPIEELLWANVYNSQQGRFLVTKDRQLYEFNLTSGEMVKVVDWMNIALSYSTLQSAYEGLENSRGDLFYLADSRLTKVHPDMVPVKKTLTLGCFADATAYGYEYSETEYTCPESLLDAIMRFNQADPEYRIVLKPMIWHDDAERNRLMIELATDPDIDVLDTSLLPPGAVDRKLLVDLLPYIDADADISREDFVPTLLAAMAERGGMYEYTDKFTLLTMLGAEHLGIEQDEWTVDKAMGVLTQEERTSFMTQEKLVMLFSWAATAEFMDRANGTCCFDSPAFIGWLELMKNISVIEPGGTDVYRTGCDWLISHDFACEAGYSLRMAFKDEANVLGFPSSMGTGSYFMKLLPADGMGHHGELHLSNGVVITQGCNTSLGIMASSPNRDDAWRFVKTFMQGESEPYLSEGIPVFRASFEQAVENSMQREQSNVNDYESFNDQDAAVIRELVYGTEGLVLRDDAIISTLQKEINAFLGGRISAEETARLIQSKMSIYMAEQYG